MQCDNGTKISEVTKKFGIRPSEIIRQGYENASVRIGMGDLAVKIDQYFRFNAVDLEVIQYCELLLNGKLKL